MSTNWFLTIHSKGHLTASVNSNVWHYNLDIHHFAIGRVKFLIGFYEKSLSPFLETVQLIEEKKPPYEPEYSESDEPQFLNEWSAAKESIELLGLQSVSLLSSTLKLFMQQSLNGVFHRKPGKLTKNLNLEDSYTAAFKKGWFNGYQELFKSEFGIDWHGSPVKCELIEELVLARNRAQHPEDIVSIGSRYSDQDMERMSAPYFVEDSIHPPEYRHWFPPLIKVSPEKMREAFNEAICLINWLEEQIENWGKTNA